VVDKTRDHSIGGGTPPPSRGEIVGGMESSRFLGEDR